MAGTEGELTFITGDVMLSGLEHDPGGFEATGGLDSQTVVPDGRSPRWAHLVDGEGTTDTACWTSRRRWHRHHHRLRQRRAGAGRPATSTHRSPTTSTRGRHVDPHAKAHARRVTARCRLGRRPGRRAPLRRHRTRARAPRRHHYVQGSAPGRGRSSSHLAGSNAASATADLDTAAAARRESSFRREQRRGSRTAKGRRAVSLLRHRRQHRQGAAIGAVAGAMGGRRARKKAEKQAAQQGRHRPGARAPRHLQRPRACASRDVAARVVPPVVGDHRSSRTSASQPTSSTRTTWARSATATSSRSTSAPGRTAGSARLT